MKRRQVVLVASGLILVLMLLVWYTYRPDDQISPQLRVGQEPYSFFVAGHTYGVPSVDNEGFHPPFKAWFPAINGQDPDLGVLTGDVVIRGTPADWDEIDTDLEELSPPVHFAAGNHDLTDRKLFETRYGPTFYGFEHQGDLFIVLDGEAEPCDIVGDQLVFLEDVLTAVESRNVFVFVHKLIWITEGTPYYDLTGQLNTAKGYNFQNNFWSDVEPLLRALDAEVYVIAGDIGVTWAMPLFYQRDGNIRFIASGMGGAEEENYLTFVVGVDGVQIQAQRLDGEPLSLGSIESYSLSHYLGE